MTINELYNLTLELLYGSEDLEEIKAKLGTLRWDERSILHSLLLTLFSRDQRFLDFTSKLAQITPTVENLANAFILVRLKIKQLGLKRSDIFYSWPLITNDKNIAELQKFDPESFKDFLGTRIWLRKYEDKYEHLSKFLRGDPSFDETTVRQLLGDEVEVSSQSVQITLPCNCTNSNDIYRGHIRSKLIEFPSVKTCQIELAKSLAARKFNVPVDNISLNLPCETCPYREFSSVLFDGYFPKKTSPQIDILFVGMNPYVDEVKQGVPFIGRAGQVLRQALEELNFHEAYNIAFYNVVPCFIPNNADPSLQVIKQCTPVHLSYVIRSLQPKVIVLLGSVAAKGFYTAFANQIKQVYGIPSAEAFWKSRGKLYQKKISLLVTWHPSYIARQGTPRHLLDQFKEDLLQITNVVKPSKLVVTSEHISEPKRQTQTQKKQKVTQRVFRRLDAISFELIQLLNQGYRPVNVTAQNLGSRKTLVLKLRHKENNDVKLLRAADYIKFTYAQLKPELQDEKNYTPLIDTNQVNFYSTDLDDYANDKWSVANTPYSYEADVDAKDYVILTLWEALGKSWTEDGTQPKIGYLDIEVFNLSGYSIDDAVKYAQDPISIITLVTKQGEVKVFSSVEPYRKLGLDLTKDQLIQKIEQGFEFAKKYLAKNSSLDRSEIKLDEIVVTDSELEMLMEFKEVVKSFELVTGWNFYFDNQYISRRLQVLGLDSWQLDSGEQVSLHETQSWTGKIAKPIYNWPGTTSIDMKDIVESEKRLTRYTLENVAQKLLKVGKVPHEESLEELAKNDTVTFIGYNIVDTLLVYFLDKLYGFAEKYVAIAMTAQCSLYSASAGPLAQIDPLMVYFAHRKGKLVRTKTKLPEEWEFDKIGGFVRPWDFVKNVVPLVQFIDVGSMYPNTMRTFNISPDSMVGYIETGEIKSDDNKRNQLLKIITEILNGGSDDTTVTLVVNPFTTRDKYRVTTKQLTQQLRQKNYIITARGTIHKSQDELGLLAEIEAYLLDQRNVYKPICKKQKDPKACLLQLGFKILANAIYGAMGNAAFRFFCPYLVEAVTLTAQTGMKFAALVLAQALNKLRPWEEIKQIYHARRFENAG